MPYKDKSKQRASRRKWYANNKESEKGYVQKRKEELARWFVEYKNILVCTKCGESHNACIVFHHKEPKNKFKEVSRMVYDGYSKDRILEEIRKCQVLCSNCHLKLHYKDRNASEVLR